MSQDILNKESCKTEPKCQAPQHHANEHLPIDAGLDIGRSASLIGKHLRNARNLILGGNHEGDHTRAITSSSRQTLDQLLHLPHFDLVVGVILLIFLSSHLLGTIESN